jgi:sugar transferase (PEP-CTERM/EpsH1 system associated)
MSTTSSTDHAPLICHVVHRFDVGGLENGVVNLINGLSAQRWRHIVVALTESTDFADRIQHADVRCLSLNKRPGKDLPAYARLYRLFRQLQPDIVHTRNLGTLDCHAVAWMAGVRGRVHGEHGWDVDDPDGNAMRYRLMRRAVGSLVQRFVAVSQEIEQWLVQDVGLPESKVVRICNGVDTEGFRPAAQSADRDRPLTFGTVTRFSEIKDPFNTLEAFLAARAEVRRRGGRIKLIMVGDGPLLGAVKEKVRSAHAHDDICFPGKRHDVENWLRRLDVFVLGSRREGISNTILEAMAAGLPVVATRTGGNLELVSNGCTGILVPPESSDALAKALLSYVVDPLSMRRHGANARQRAVEQYSIDRMISNYDELYRSIPIRPMA